MRNDADISDRSQGKFSQWKPIKKTKEWHAR